MEFTFLDSEIDTEHLFDEEAGNQEESTENTEDQEQTEQTTEINVEELFNGEEEQKQQSDKGGSNEDAQGKESTETNGGSSSPNFYSSIANAIVEDGAFPDLETKDIKDAESFSKAITEAIEKRLDETQKRVNEALNNGVQPSVIHSYENTLRQLDSIKDETLEDENNEEYRKKLIYQDLLNKGYSKEDAQEEVEEIVANGTDIKKAKRALNNMKEYFKKQYQEVLDEAKEEASKKENEAKDRTLAIKKDLLENTKAFGDLEISKDIRQKAFDSLTKPVYKDPETGKIYTSIQKYEKDNPKEFSKNIALIYTLTDGFSKIDNLVKAKVNKENKKAIKELESKLSNTQRFSNGSLNFANGINDPESAFDGYELDI